MNELVPVGSRGLGKWSECEVLSTTRSACEVARALDHLLMIIDQLGLGNQFGRSNIVKTSGFANDLVKLFLEFYGCFYSRERRRSMSHPQMSISRTPKFMTFTPTFTFTTDQINQ